MEYIIIDGGSTDGSVEIIKKYESNIAYWVSETDKGMYHAINKGFYKSSGDIMCWINSDDMLWEGSLSYVADVFKMNPHVHWLQGYPSVIDKDGNLLYQREPVASKYHFYRKEFVKDLKFIQQESTFWSRTLWDKAGGRLCLDYKLAADFDLWMQFFHFEKLLCSHRQLAAFRMRQGQKSSDRKTYINEALSSVASHRRILGLPDRWNLLVNKKSEPLKWID